MKSETLLPKIISPDELIVYNLHLKYELECLERVLHFARFVILNQGIWEQRYAEVGAGWSYENSKLPSKGISGYVDFTLREMKTDLLPVLISQDTFYVKNAASANSYSAPRKNGTGRKRIICSTGKTNEVLQEHLSVPLESLLDPSALFQYSTIYRPELLSLLVLNSYVYAHDFMYDYCLFVSFDAVHYVEEYGKRVAEMNRISYD